MAGQAIPSIPPPPRPEPSSRNLNPIDIPDDAMIRTACRRRGMFRERLAAALCGPRGLPNGLPLDCPTHLSLPSQTTLRRAGRPRRAGAKETSAVESSGRVWPVRTCSRQPCGSGTIIGPNASPAGLARTRFQPDADPRQLDGKEGESENGNRSEPRVRG